MTSLHLIRRRDRMEFKAGRNAALYRSQRSGARDTTKNQPGSWAASLARPSGTANPVISPTASTTGRILSHPDLTPGIGEVDGRLGTKAADPEVPVRHRNV